MDLRIKQDWCAALRSGEYKQGTGALRDENGHYCCLGVLTDVVGEMPAIAPDFEGYDDDGFYEYHSGIVHGEDDILSEKVRQMVGLDSLDPQVEYEGQLISLSILNDHKKLTFGEIADLIEEQL